MKEELKAGQQELKAGQAKLKAEQELLQAGQAKLKADQEQLQAGQELLQAGQEVLQAGQDKLEADFTRLLASLLPASVASARQVASGGDHVGDVPADGQSTGVFERLGTLGTEAGGGDTSCFGDVAAPDAPVVEPADDVAVVTAAGNTAAATAAAVDGDAGLVSGGETPASSVEAAAVLSTLTEEEQTEEEEQEALNSSVSAPVVLPAPSNEGRQDRLEPRIGELSARLEGLLSVLLAGMDSNAPSLHSLLASTTAAGVPATDPEESVLSDIRAATVAARAVRGELESLAGEAIAREENVVGGDSERVLAASCGTQEEGKTKPLACVLKIGEAAGKEGLSGSNAIQGQRTSGGGSAWKEDGNVSGARGGAGAATLWGKGIYSTDPVPLVPHAAQEEPTTVVGASAGGAARATAIGGVVGGVLDSGIEHDPWEASVPLLEATVDPAKGVVGDDSIQAESSDDSAEEAARTLASEMVESVIEAAVVEGASLITGVDVRTVEESTAVYGARVQGGDVTWRVGTTNTGATGGAGAAETLAGNGVDFACPVGGAVEPPPEKLLTVADAVAGSARAPARWGVIGSGVGPASGETSMPLPEGTADQGVSEFGDVCVDALAIEGSVAESLRQAGGDVKPSVAAGGVEAAPESERKADDAGGVEGPPAPKGEREGGTGVAASHGGVSIRRRKVSRAEYLHTARCSSHHLTACSTAGEFVVCSPPDLAGNCFIPIRCGEMPPP